MKRYLEKFDYMETGSISNDLMDRGCVVFIDRSTTPPTISRTKETDEWGILVNDVVSHGGDPVCDEIGVGVPGCSVLLNGVAAIQVVPVMEKDWSPKLGDDIFYDSSSDKMTGRKTPIRVGRLMRMDPEFWEISVERWGLLPNEV